MSWIEYTKEKNYNNRRKQKEHISMVLPTIVLLAIVISALAYIAN